MQNFFRLCLVIGLLVLVNNYGKNGNSEFSEPRSEKSGFEWWIDVFPWQKVFEIVLEFLKNLWNKPTDEGVNPSRIENNKKTTSLTSKRPKEQLLAIFMWGVKMYFDPTHCLPLVLRNEDFQNHLEITMNYNNLMYNYEANLPSHFTFKEYCPLVFKNLRERFGIDDLDFRESLTSSEPNSVEHDEVMVRHYLTRDALFILTKISNKEAEKILEFVKKYQPYVVERHGKTLLPKYVGMYQVTFGEQTQDIVVTKNVYGNQAGNFVTEFTVGKDTNKGNEVETGKGNDFTKDGGHIHIGDQAREQLIKTLTADAQFLTRERYINYQLIVAVYHTQVGGQGENKRQSHGTCGYSNPLLNYAIISDLKSQPHQMFLFSVNDAHKFDSCKERGVSTCEPDQYSKQFMDFITKAIE